MNILQWFNVSSLKPDSGKFEFMLLGTNTNVKENLFLDENKIQTSQKVVLLGITVDNS